MLLPLQIFTLYNCSTRNNIAAFYSLNENIKHTQTLFFSNTIPIPTVYFIVIYYHTVHLQYAYMSFIEKYGTGLVGAYITGPVGRVDYRKL